MADLTPYEYDIFLSHNHNDQGWTTGLAERLEKEDWQGRKIKVFFSPWDIRPGQSIPKEIETALSKSRKVGLVLSPDAVASAWVELERLVTTHIAITARDERLIPILRHDCKIPALLQHILGIDFRDDANFDENYQTLVKIIKDEPLPRRARVLTGNAIVLTPLIPRPPVVGFVARRDSEGRNIVARLKEELAPPKNQLVALHGPGGVGKTTLAAETVRALADQFEGLIVWISADGREDFALSMLLDEIAGQLGNTEVRPLPLKQKTTAVQGLIAAAPTLIVLDNFETIAIAAERTNCVDFLSRHASCPVLITSRDRIGPARNITIPAMSVEESEQFLTLLIEQASNPSAFAQIDRERIINESERNPLIMQWVVAQIDLAQEPDTVLDELTHGIGDAAERVFDRSFRLPQLGEDGRAALMALSLFAPDASRAALAEVAGFGEDLRRLNEATKPLASLWLIKATALGQRLVVEGLTRELTKARLLGGPLADDIRKRFISYFLQYAEAYKQPTGEDYEELEKEKDNVLSAMDVAFDIKDWATVIGLAYAIARPVDGVLSVHGYWDEALKRNEQGFEAALEASSEGDVAGFAHNQAGIHQNRGDLEEARRLYDQSLEIAKKLGNQRGVAVTLHNLAAIAEKQGEFKEARRLYDQSLGIKKKFGDQSGIASTLNQLGILAQVQGELDEARRLYDQSLVIVKKLGNQRSVASTLHNLAVIAQAQGELQEARRLYDQSLEIAKKLGNQSGIASTLHELGRLAQAQGELQEARRLYDQSLRIKKKLGDQSGIAFTLHELGNLSEEEDDKDLAAELFREAVAILEKLGSPRAEIARRSLARVEGKSS
jgi:tetratricopeptide (TPR) repeat protein